MTIWFTSDTHFGHSRMLDKRPFASIEEMDEKLIELWNKTIKPGDLVYHLGDFSFHRPERTVWVVHRLNGQKYLVTGNHDERILHHAAFTSAWIWIKQLADIKINEQKIVLCHYAMRTWNCAHYGAWQLYGHSHGSLSESQQRSTDVGVDCWNYSPVSFDTLRELMAKRGFQPVDHHKGRP